ncbi:UNVERIFIED_ORG: hypothetical protein RHOFW104R5_42850 [Rhodanobacter sp. FW104-R5]
MKWVPGRVHASVLASPLLPPAEKSLASAFDEPTQISVLSVLLPALLASQWTVATAPSQFCKVSGATVIAGFEIAVAIWPDAVLLDCGEAGGTEVDSFWQPAKASRVATMRTVRLSMGFSRVRKGN